MGTVVELWRYPVKSMQGHRLDQVDLDVGGIDGDRAWAVLHGETGKVLSAKTVAPLLDATAALVGDDVTITLPDGETTGSAAPDVDAILSGWLDRPVRLARAGSAGDDISYQMTFDPPNDGADLVDIPVPPGTFFDLAPVHVLTTGALRGRFDRRRFRPNVLVDLEHDDAGPGGPEDAWVGGPITVGGARLHVMLRTVRCALPLRGQPASGDEPALDRDVDVYRTLSDGHDNHLGVYATVDEAGPVAVGDAVTAG